MIEAVTWSFIAPGHASFFGGKPELALANPISAELSQMRPSLIPGLALAVQRNSDRSFPDTALFEVGQIFTGEAAEDQLTSAAGVRHRWAKPGGSGRHWSRPTAGVDALDAKADALAALVAAGASGQALQIVPGAPAWFHPGRSGTIQMGAQNVLGHFGELHPRAMELLDVEGPLVAFELVLDRLPQPKSKTTHTRTVLELSPFQPVERDFAFVIERGVRAADVVRAAQNAERKLISAVSVFDVYEGRGIEPGKKSIAISVTLQPREKTLTEQEIDAVANKIVAEVSKRTGATLRS
jgi:phenylalanyl-tRNA synthetase beta chain